ncbi:MAG: NAD(P)/FAD-dependent oxidoreductase [Opitutales bacterium]
MSTPTPWDDEPWSPLPKLEGVMSAEVCVVGLGGSGLSALEELQARGIKAVGLDARTVGAGATGRNPGFLLAGLSKFFHDTVTLFGRETATELYRLTIAEIKRLADDMPGLVRLNGSLRIAADAAEVEDCQRHLAALRACGFPAEPYKGREGEGLLLPSDGVFQPLARVRQMARRLRTRGGRLYEGSPVRQLQPGRVETEGGVVQCHAVLVAVDGRLDRIIPELAKWVRTARLQLLATGPAPEVNFPRAVYRRYGYDHWQQLTDRSLVFSGFRDHEREEEWTDSEETTATMQARMENFLRQELKVRAPITHRWAASVGYTQDALPVLDEVRQRVWAFGGYNGTGSVVGALCGRAAAQLACGQSSEWAGLLAKAHHRFGNRMAHREEPSK